MKKACLFILSVFILALASCSLLDNERTTSFSINVDDAFISQIRNSSRAANYPASENFTVVITLSGGTNQQKTVTMTRMDLDPHDNPDFPNRTKNNTVSFDKIPLHVPFDIQVEVYCGRELFYEASKKGVVLSSRGTTDLTMILKELLNTQFALYKEKYSSGLYNKYWFPTDSLTTKVQAEDTEYFTDFCFNANGEVIYTDGDSSPKGEYSQFPNGGLGGIESICCDLTDNSVYLIGSRVDGSLEFSNFTYYKDISSYISNPPVDDPVIYGSVAFRANDIPSDDPDYFSYADDSDDLYKCAAGNGSLFFGFKEDFDNSFYILKFNLKNKGDYISSDYAGKATFSFATATNNPTITDMVCIDGYCYVLIKESNWSPTTVYNKTVSRGLIAKINCDTLDVTTSGLSTIKTTPAGVIKSAWSYTGDLLFRDENGQTLYTDTFELTEDFIYAGPSTSEKQSCFFGPDKFIAIKPKKLVISDAGTYIWTNADGVFASKRINRIVYVDLNSLSITDTVDINTEVAEFSIKNPSARYTDGDGEKSVPDGLTLYRRFMSDTVEYHEIFPGDPISPIFADQ